MEEREETIDSLLTITTPRLVLREASPEDIPVLYKWRNDERFQALCSVRRTSIEYENFVREINNDLSNDRLMQMMIYRKTQEAAIGTIYAYEYNPTDQNIFITIYLERKFERLGYGVETIYAFGRYLFETLGLYKIYIEIYEYNKLSLSTAQNLQFSEEGHFLKHRQFNGQRWDLYRFAIYQDDAIKIQRYMKYWNNRTTSLIGNT